MLRRTGPLRARAEMGSFIAEKYFFERAKESLRSGSCRWQQHRFLPSMTRSDAPLPAATMQVVTDGRVELTDGGSPA